MKYKAGQTGVYIKADGIEPLSSEPIGAKFKIIEYVGNSGSTNGDIYKVLFINSGRVRGDIYAKEMSINQRHLPWL